MTFLWKGIYNIVELTKSDCLYNIKSSLNGRIAQMGEHSPYKAGVTGSIPVPPTVVMSASEGC